MPMRVTEPRVTRASELSPETDPASAYDWSGWEKWLQGHLAIQHAAITEEFIETCGYALGVKANELHDEIAALETQLNALKTQLARLPAAGPPGPSGKMSPVKTWQPDTVFYEGEIVLPGFQGDPIPRHKWRKARIA